MWSVATSVAHTRRSTSRSAKTCCEQRDGAGRRRRRPGRGARRTAAASAPRRRTPPRPSAARPSTSGRRSSARRPGSSARGTSTRHADRVDAVVGRLGLELGEVPRGRVRPAALERDRQPAASSPSRPSPGSCPGCRRRARRRGRTRPARGAAGWCGGRSSPTRHRTGRRRRPSSVQRSTSAMSASAQASSMRPSM